MKKIAKKNEKFNVKVLEVALESFRPLKFYNLKLNAFDDYLELSKEFPVEEIKKIYYIFRIEGWYRNYSDDTAISVGNKYIKIIKNTHGINNSSILGTIYFKIASYYKE